MKKIIILSMAVILMTSCTVYIPYETETIVPDSYRLNLILNIYPEDAKVIANGRFIGEAYEFSTEKTALIVNKPNTSIVLKKRGFIEEKIDIRKYNSGTERISIDLQPDKRQEQPKGHVKAAEAKVPPVNPVTGKETETEKITEKAEKPEKEPEMFIYTIKITPASCAIYIDGKFWGTSPADGVIINNMRITAGEHKIDVYKPGYRNYTKRFKASVDSEKKLIITLLKSK